MKAKDFYYLILSIEKLAALALIAYQLYFLIISN